MERRLVEVAHDNVASLEVQKKNAEANYQQGVAARNDILKADVALSEAVQRERNIFKQLIVLRSNLNQLHGYRFAGKCRTGRNRGKNLPESRICISYIRLPRRKGPNTLPSKPLSSRPNTTKQRPGAAIIHDVSAFAQYYREGEDFLADNNPYSNNENASVGLRVDWNLFEGGKTRASELEWEYRLRGIEQRRDDLLQKIRLQVENAFEQLKVAKANIETTRVAVEQAEENDRITTLQYKEQVVIFLEVLNAQVFLAQTRADFYQALYGYEIAKAELERAIGGPID